VSGETRSAAAGGPAPAGWGVPSFLPPAVAARALRDDAREALEARRAEDERERRAEERHSAAMALYAQQAEARGEVLDVMAMARGEVRGRSVQDILAAAVAASEVEDRRAEMWAWQQGHGEPERLHVDVGEPRLLAPAARSATAMAIFHRSRRFQDWLEKRKAAEAARRAVEAEHDWGLVDNVTVRPREDRGDVVFARHEAARRQYERACAEIGERPVSIR
jgi:hypothetical protein